MHFALTLSSLVNRFADLSRLSSTALIAAIWQGVLLAGTAGIGMRFAPRIPAAARFAIWFAVFALIAALPFLSLTPHAAAARSIVPHAAWLNLDARWTLAIAAVWAAASLFRAATLLAAALRVRTLARRAKSIEASGLQPAASRRAQLCSSSDVDRPTVIGFFSPKILVPAWLLEKLTPAELDQIVLHESTHLHRADDWLNLLQKLALVVFPLNPALAWVERRLCFERELACDEHVLATLAARADRSDRSATDYASCLTNLAGYRLEYRDQARRGLVRNLALALGALGTSARESELGRRVARILRPVARMKPLHSRLAISTAIAALLFTTTALERTPQVIAFTSAAPAMQLASVSPRTGLLPGAATELGEVNTAYRAVAASMTLPAAPQPKPIGDATPRLSAMPGAPSYAQRRVGSVGDAGHRSIPALPRPIEVRADRSLASAAPHLIAARQPQPQSGIIVTRWTVFRSPDGYRIVRTSAVFSSSPAAQNLIRRDVDPAGAPPTPASAGLVGIENPISDSSAQVSTAPRDHDIPQPIPPYAAVPVPGGWLVFQL